MCWGCRDRWICGAHCLASRPYLSGSRPLRDSVKKKKKRWMPLTNTRGLPWSLYIQMNTCTHMNTHREKLDSSHPFISPHMPSPCFMLEVQDEPCLAVCGRIGW